MLCVRFEGASRSNRSSLFGDLRLRRCSKPQANNDYGSTAVYHTLLESNHHFAQT